MNTHLEAIESVGTLSAGGLSDGQAKDLGGHANGALHAKLLVLGVSHELSANWRTKMNFHHKQSALSPTLLEVGDVSGAQSDADAAGDIFGRLIDQ